MSEHVCIQQAEIDRIRKENEMLRSEISQVRSEHTDTRETMIEVKSDMKYVRETVSALKVVVDKIADEPRAKWEQLQRQVLTFVVGGGLTGFLIWAYMIAKSYAVK